MLRDAVLVVLAAVTVNSSLSNEFKRHIYTLEDFCEIFPRTTEFHEQLIIRSQKSHEIAYKANISCTMGINTTDYNMGLMIAMRTVVTENCNDNVTIRAPVFGTQMRCGSLYSVDDAAHSFDIEQGVVQISWKTAPKKNNFTVGLGFEMTVTPYKKSCQANEQCFKCSNGHYIHEHFVCNKRNNCGDMSDESSCDSSQHSLAFPIGISILCGTAMLVFCVALWKYSLKRETSREEQNERTPLFTYSVEQGIAYDPSRVSRVAVNDDPKTHSSSIVAPSDLPDSSNLFDGPSTTANVLVEPPKDVTQAGSS